MTCRARPQCRSRTNRIAPVSMAPCPISTPAPAKQECPGAHFCHGCDGSLDGGAALSPRISPPASRMLRPALTQGDAMASNHPTATAMPASTNDHSHETNGHESDALIKEIAALKAHLASLSQLLLER